MTDKSKYLTNCSCYTLFPYFYTLAIFSFFPHPDAESWLEMPTSILPPQMRLDCRVFQPFRFCTGFQCMKFLEYQKEYLQDACWRDRSRTSILSLENNSVTLSKMCQDSVWCTRSSVSWSGYWSRQYGYHFGVDQAPVLHMDILKSLWYLMYLQN